MSAFWALTKQLIKNTLKPNFKDKKEKNKYITTLAVLAVCIGIPYIFMLVNMFGLLKASAELGYLAEILSIGFFASQLLTFVFGLFAYVNIMYFSKDNEFLFTLPLRPVSIFWAKFITILLYELIFSVVTVLPMSIVAIIATAGIGAFEIGIVLMMLPATILLPLMAILVIAILSYPIMKIMQYFKKRPIVGAVFTIIFVAAIYIAIYLPILLNTPQIDAPDIDGNLSGEISGDANGQLDVTAIYATLLPSLANVGKYLFHTYFLAQSMLAGGVKAFGYAMAFIGIVLALAAVGTLLAMWQFKRISQSVYEGDGNVSNKKKQGEVKQRSVNAALVKKEFSSILKQSNMLVQAGMMMVLPPILIAFIGNMQANMTNAFVGVAVAELITKLMLSSNTSSILAVSKDGEGALIAKTMPLSGKQIVTSKIIMGFTFSAITVLLSTIALCFTKGINVVSVLGFFVSNMIYAWAVNRFCVYRDLKNPRIHWKNIQEIIKNNFSSVIPMFLAFIPGLLTMGPLMICSLLLQINVYAIAAICSAISIVVSGVYYLIIIATTKGNVEEYWRRIE
jgi:ABC-2 type transport system permease protein